MNITIVGINDIGVAHGVLLSQYNEVTMFDRDNANVDMINSREFRSEDLDFENHIDIEELDIKGTSNIIEAYEDAEYVLISFESRIDDEEFEGFVKDILEVNPDAIIIVKSKSVYPGFTKKAREIFGTENIIYSPDFSREDSPFYDTFHPSKIVMGEDSERAIVFAELLAEGAFEEDIDILYKEFGKEGSV